MKPKYHGWVTLVVSVLIVVGLPALVFRGQGTAAFDKEPARVMEALDPDYVFIGNSMLESRVNAGLMGELAGGQEIYLLVTPAVTSAAWYLQLKNYVVNAEVDPKAVFIFFRANELTDPLYRTDGPYRDVLQRMQSGPEPAFASVIASNANWSTNIGGRLQDIYPIQARRLHAEEAISRLAAGVLLPNLLIDSARHVLGTINPDAYRARLEDHLTIRRETNDVFDRVNLRSGARLVGRRTNDQDFTTTLDDSFLPLMIEQAHLIDLPLIFVRVQQRPGGDGTIQNDPLLDQYIADLRNYTESNGFALIDMNGHPDIRLEHYKDGDHISPSFKEEYTRILFKETSDLFE